MALKKILSSERNRIKKKAGNNVKNKVCRETVQIVSNHQFKCKKIIKNAKMAGKFIKFETKQKLVRIKKIGKNLLLKYL